MNGPSNNYHLAQVQEESSDIGDIPMHQHMRSSDPTHNIPPVPMSPGMHQATMEQSFDPVPRSRSNTWPLPEGIEALPAAEPNLPQAMAAMGMEQGSTKKNTSRRNPWGNMSYAELIATAILASDQQRATLSQIYEYMVNNIPYFKDKGDTNSSAGWKNSIRHNLSLHNRFMRVQNEGTGKSSWWILNADAKSGKNTRRRANTLDNNGRTDKKRGRTKKKPEMPTNLGPLTATTPSPSNSLNEVVDSPSAHAPFMTHDFRQRASSSASSCGAYSPVNGPESDLHEQHRGAHSPASYYGKPEYWENIIDPAASLRAHQQAYSEGHFTEGLTNNVRQHQDVWQGMANFAAMSRQRSSHFPSYPNGFSQVDYSAFNQSTGQYPGYSLVNHPYEYPNESQINSGHPTMPQPPHMHHNPASNHVQSGVPPQNISPSGSMCNLSPARGAESFPMCDASQIPQPTAVPFQYGARAVPNGVNGVSSSLTRSMSHISQESNSSPPTQYGSSTHRVEATTLLTVAVAHKDSNGSQPREPEPPVTNGPDLHDLESLQMQSLSCDVNEVIQHEEQHGEGWSFDLPISSEPSYNGYHGANTESYGSHTLRDGSTGQLNGHGTGLTPYAPANNLVR